MRVKSRSGYFHRTNLGKIGNLAELVLRHYALLVPVADIDDTRGLLV
jgi:hypothetical protein